MATSFRSKTSQDNNHEYVSVIQGSNLLLKLKIDSICTPEFLKRLKALGSALSFYDPDNVLHIPIALLPLAINKGTLINTQGKIQILSPTVALITQHGEAKEIWQKANDRLSYLNNVALKVYKERHSHLAKIRNASDEILVDEMKHGISFKPCPDDPLMLENGLECGECYLLFTIMDDIILRFLDGSKPFLYPIKEKDAELEAVRPLVNNEIECVQYASDTKSQPDIPSSILSYPSPDSPDLHCVTIEEFVETRRQEQTQEENDDSTDEEISNTGMGGKRKRKTGENFTSTKKTKTSTYFYLGHTACIIEELMQIMAFMGMNPYQCPSTITLRKRLEYFAITHVKMIQEDANITTPGFLAQNYMAYWQMFKSCRQFDTVVTPIDFEELQINSVQLMNISMYLSRCSSIYLKNANSGTNNSYSFQFDNTQNHSLALFNATGNSPFLFNMIINYFQSCAQLMPVQLDWFFPDLDKLMKVNTFCLLGRYEITLKKNNYKLKCCRFGTIRHANQLDISPTGMIHVDEAIIDEGKRKTLIGPKFEMAIDALYETFMKEYLPDLGSSIDGRQKVFDVIKQILKSLVKFVKEVLNPLDFPDSESLPHMSKTTDNRMEFITNSYINHPIQTLGLMGFFNMASVNRLFNCRTKVILGNSVNETESFEYLKTKIKGPLSGTTKLESLQVVGEGSPFISLTNWGYSPGKMSNGLFELKSCELQALVSLKQKHVACYYVGLNSKRVIDMSNVCNDGKDGSGASACGSSNEKFVFIPSTSFATSNDSFKSKTSVETQNTSKHIECTTSRFIYIIYDLLEKLYPNCDSFDSKVFASLKKYLSSAFIPKYPFFQKYFSFIEWLDILSYPESSLKILILGGLLYKKGFIPTGVSKYPVKPQCNPQAIKYLTRCLISDTSPTTEKESRRDDTQLTKWNLSKFSRELANSAFASELSFCTFKKFDHANSTTVNIQYDEPYISEFSEKEFETFNVLLKRGKMSTQTETSSFKCKLFYQLQGASKDFPRQVEILFDPEIVSTFQSNCFLDIVESGEREQYLKDYIRLLTSQPFHRMNKFYAANSHLTEIMRAICCHEIIDDAYEFVVNTKWYMQKVKGLNEIEEVAGGGGNGGHDDGTDDNGSNVGCSADVGKDNGGGSGNVGYDDGGDGNGSNVECSAHGGY